MKITLTLYITLLLILALIGALAINVDRGEEVQTTAVYHTIEAANLSRTGNSEIETKFKDDAYSFSMELHFIDFQSKIEFKDEKRAKEHLQMAHTYLNKLTKRGTEFSAASRLQNDSDWTKFVEDIARVKYDYITDSEIVNDLNVAGALILQAERYHDEPSLHYLYKIISDLNSSVNGEAPIFNTTRTFGHEKNFNIIYEYLQSKIKPMRK